MSKYKWQYAAKRLLRDIDIAIPIALLETMDYVELVTQPLVPIDTGALRDSFESYLEDSRTAVGKWEVYDKGFPYGYYQYFNHQEYSFWVKSSINMYGENMKLVFKDALLRGLRNWRN